MPNHFICFYKINFDSLKLSAKNLSFKINTRSKLLQEDFHQSRSLSISSILSNVQKPLVPWNTFVVTRNSLGVTSRSRTGVLHITSSIVSLPSPIYTVPVISAQYCTTSSIWYSIIMYYIISIAIYSRHWTSVNNPGIFCRLYRIREQAKGQEAKQHKCFQHLNNKSESFFRYLGTYSDQENGSLSLSSSFRTPNLGQI